MSTSDLTIQVLVRDDPADAYGVLTERKVRFEQSELIEHKVKAGSLEFWQNDGGDTAILAELDWDIVILSSNENVILDLWTVTNKTPLTAGTRLFLGADTFVVLRRELWTNTTSSRPAFGAGSASDIALIEVEEFQGREATVTGRFYKQATS